MTQLHSNELGGNLSEITKITSRGAALMAGAVLLLATCALRPAFADDHDHMDHDHMDHAHMDHMDHMNHAQMPHGHQAKPSRAKKKKPAAGHGASHANMPPMDHAAMGHGAMHAGHDMK